MKRSTDAGLTWSKLQVVLDPFKLFGPTQCPPSQKSTAAASCEFWDPTPVADATTGEIFLLTTRSWAHNGITNEQSRMTGRMDAWLLKSSDLGATWSEPKNITSSLWSTRWRLGTPSNGHGVQLRSGWWRQQHSFFLIDLLVGPCGSSNLARI
jgi:sialidase-1